MALNLPGVPFKLTAQDMGGFDLAGALQQGFKAYQDFHEAKNTPKRLSEALLAQQLSNKINKAKADYAERNEAAGLANTLAGTQNLNDTHGLTPLHRRLLEAQINKANRPEKVEHGDYGKAAEDYNYAAEHYGADSWQATEARKNAERIARGTQSANAMSALGKATNEYHQAVKDYGPDSDEAKNYKSYVERLSSGIKTSTIRPTGELANALVLEDLKATEGEGSPRYQAALKAANAETKKQESIQSNRTASQHALAFKLLPAAEKQRVIATAVGAGFDPTEASTQLASGKTLNEMVKEKGKSLNEITPVYPLPKETQKQLIGRRAFIKEIETIEKRLTPAMAAYSTKFYGYSPSQIADALSGENEDKQAEFLAARALQPELAALRLNAANAKVGITAIHDMKQLALGNSKIFEGRVSSKVYTKMQNNISKWIKEASQSFNDSIESQSRIGGNYKAPSSNNDEITQEDLEHTAKVNNLTVAQVKQRLGL